MDVRVFIKNLQNVIIMILHTITLRYLKEFYLRHI